MQVSRKKNDPKTENDPKSENDPKTDGEPIGFLQKKVAEILGISETTVGRRAEAGALHRWRDGQGRWLYHPIDVARLVLEGVDDDEQPLAEPDQERNKPSRYSEDNIDPKVFKLLNEGMSVRQVVVALNLPAEPVNESYRKWLKMGDEPVIPDQVYDKLEAVSGETLTPERLTSILGRIADSAAKYAELVYACTVCGADVQLTPEVWQKLVAGGALKAWGHGKCVEAINKATAEARK